MFINQRPGFVFRLHFLALGGCSATESGSGMACEIGYRVSDGGREKVNNVGRAVCGMEWDGWCRSIKVL